MNKQLRKATDCDWGRIQQPNGREPNRIWGLKRNGRLHPFRRICRREPISDTHFRQLFSRHVTFDASGTVVIEVGGSVLLSTSSLNIGGGFDVLRGEGIIKNGRTVTVSGLNVGDGGFFFLDKTSSATMGACDVAGGLSIDGTLLVKGALVNSNPFPFLGGPTTIINGFAIVQAVQNDGDMTVNGKLELNGGGLVNNGFGTLTISGVTNVTGGVAGGSVIVNPTGTLTADSYAGLITDVWRSKSFWSCKCDG